MKKRKYIFLLAGLTVFTFLVYKAGFASIYDALELVSPGFIVIIILHFVCWCFQNAAWALELGKIYDGIGIWTLTKARIMGDAFNAVIPLGNFGGEPIKLFLLKDKGPKTAIAASQILDKTIFALGSLLYILTGIGIAVFILNVFSFKQKVVILLTLALMAWGLIVFIRKKDFFSALSGRLTKLGIGRNFLSAKMDSIVRIDEIVASFYRSERRRFLTSVILHFSARLVSAVEYYLVFRFLNLDLTFSQAFCIHSLTLIAYTIFFFIPGHWGVAEGAQGFIFMALGLDFSNGIKVGVVWRVRHLFWTLIGLLIFSALDPKGKREALKDVK